MTFRLTGDYDDYRNHESAYIIDWKFTVKTVEEAIKESREFVQKIREEHTLDSGECCLTYLDATLSRTNKKMVWKTAFIPAQPAKPYVPAQAARPAVPSRFQENR